MRKFLKKDRGGVGRNVLVIQRTLVVIDWRFSCNIFDCVWLSGAQYV